MRQRAFPGRGPEVDARYQRAGQWLLAAIYQNEKALEWCKTSGIRLVMEPGETIGKAGSGFLVPNELSNAILDLRDSFGAFRRRARLVPIGSSNSSAARRLGGVGAFFLPASTPANETGTNVDQINMTARKIGALVRISNELEEDAIVDMVDFIANEVAFAFAALEDDCAFNGTGTSAYGKMRGLGSIVLDGQHAKAKVTAASGHNTYATIDSVDLSALMGSVRASAIPNAAWFGSQTFFANTICRIAAAGSGYLETRMIDGVLTPCFMGFPVILSQKFPLVTTTLSGSMMAAFGDMYAGAVLGQRRGVTLARSADRYMDLDETAVLGTERFHAVVHDVGDNLNFGSLAALIGN